MLQTLIFIFVCLTTIRQLRATECQSLGSPAVQSPSDVWGSYLPGLQIGVRACSPKSLVASVGWSNGDTSILRHSSTDKLLFSGWVHHDGAGYGQHTIKDDEPSIGTIIRSSFITEETQLKCRNSSFDVPAIEQHQSLTVHSHHQSIQFSGIESQATIDRRENQQRLISVFASFGLEDDDGRSSITLMASKNFTISDRRTNNEMGDTVHGTRSGSWILLQGKSTDSTVGDFLVSITMTHISDDVLDGSQRIESFWSSDSLPTPAADYAWNLPRFVRLKGMAKTTSPPNNATLRKLLSADELKKLKMGVGARESGVSEKNSNETATLWTLKEPLHGWSIHPSDTTKKMVVIQSVVPIAKLRQYNLHIDLFSVPTTAVNHGTDTFVSRLGMRSCSGAHSELALPTSPCLSNIEEFLKSFFTGNRQQWMESRLKPRLANFVRKTQNLFLTSSPATHPVDSKISNDTRAAAFFAISNLLGGYGYFHGRLKTRIASNIEIYDLNVTKPRVVENDSLPLSLFSGTPSRSAFPRPFLWDEGFHSSVLRLWDYRRFLKVLGSWFDLQFDEEKHNYLGTRADLNLSLWNGWIPREVSLGVLAQSTVPLHFQFQDVRVANPPTLLLPFVEHLKLVEEIEKYLNEPFSERVLSSSVLKFLHSVEGTSLLDSNDVVINSSVMKSSSIQYASLKHHLSLHARDQCDLDVPRLSAAIRETREFTSKYYEQIIKWFHYFRRTQQSRRALPVSSNDKEQEFLLHRWSLRSSDHTLASGFDDAPRGLVVDLNETHIDLQSWIAFMARSIGSICRFQSSQYPSILAKDNCNEWDKTLEQTLATIFPREGKKKSFIQTLSTVLGRQTLIGSTSVFYNPSLGILGDNIGRQPRSREKKGSPLIVPPWRTDGRCGFQFPSMSHSTIPGLCNPHSESKCCSPSGWCGSTSDYCECPNCFITPPLTHKIWIHAFDAYIDDARSPHLGYINLIPLVLELLPVPIQNGYVGSPLKPTPNMAPFLNLIAFIASESHFLSHSGLRSLSKSDPLYHTGENYWRGNMWVNINYLFLRSLRSYYIPALSCNPDTLEGECNSSLSRKLTELYKTVRDRMVKAITTEYIKKQTLFESYDDNTGEGRGAKGFTGWTTTFLLLFE